MIRTLGLSLALSIFCSTLYGADTFAARLGHAKHAGLAIDADLSAYVLHIYTPEQFQEHKASLQTFRKEDQAFNERLRGYERERRLARERGATPIEINAITAKRNRDVATQPTSPFEKRIQLHNVIRTGDDYILLSPIDAEAEQVIVPLHRIGRVVISGTRKENAPANGRESSN